MFRVHFSCCLSCVQCVSTAAERTLFVLIHRVMQEGIVSTSDAACTRCAAAVLCRQLRRSTQAQARADTAATIGVTAPVLSPASSAPTTTLVAVGSEVTAPTLQPASSAQTTTSTELGDARGLLINMRDKRVHLTWWETPPAESECAVAWCGWIAQGIFCMHVYSYPTNEWFSQGHALCRRCSRSHNGGRAGGVG